MIKNKIKDILPYIILIFSIIVFLGSSIFLYNKSIEDTSIQYDELQKEVKKIEGEINSLGIDFKNIDEEKILALKKIEEDKKLNLEDILNANKFKKAEINECFNKNFSKEEQELCLKDFYFHKYSLLLNKKGIIDKRMCDSIEKIFGKDSYLYERCIFTYSVNSGTKYLNIKECEKIPDSARGNFGKEECINNIIYSIFGKDNTIGKYMEKVKERGEEDKSPLYTQVLNKYGTYIKGEMKGVDFFDFDINDYLDNRYKSYLLQKEEMENLEENK